MHTVLGKGNKKARYFAGLDVFALLRLGVNGSGGVASIARSRSSALFRASASGRKSSFDSSAASSDAVGCLRFMMGV
jgi:hypothetical protein